MNYFLNMDLHMNIQPLRVLRIFWFMRSAELWLWSKDLLWRDLLASQASWRNMYFNERSTKPDGDRCAKWNPKNPILKTPIAMWSGSFPSIPLFKREKWIVNNAFTTYLRQCTNLCLSFFLPILRFCKIVISVPHHTISASLLNQGEPNGPESHFDVNKSRQSSAG